ncbi:MAG: hypothetical protein K0R31_100 [Clostridiales bacterium]|nr:hypothetical protein [Clostridiales bacterium]
MIIISKRFLITVFLFIFTLNIYGCSKPTIEAKPNQQEEKQVVNSNAQPSPSPTQPEPAKESPSISPEKVLEAGKLYEHGYDLYNEFKYDEAITYYTKAIDLDPSNYKALNGKGIALCFKKSYTDGMSLIRKSLEMKPDFAYANFNMAMAYKLQNDLGNSLVWFEKALSYDSKDTWSYYGISTIYADWDNPEKSIEYLKKAITLDKVRILVLCNARLLLII